MWSIYQGRGDAKVPSVFVPLTFFCCLGKPGDIGVYGASTQHCAMANRDVEPRVGMLVAMIPVYLKPYHDIHLPEEALSSASQDMRTLLAVDHPYPVKL